MLVIGITGGIGSGKSAVSQFLVEKGVTLIDADKIGHAAYLPHTPAWEEVVATFGPTIVGENEEIDRKSLGAIVFSDPDKLAQLNAIMHPKMADMIRKEIINYKNQGIEFIILEAAILIEANWLPLVDEVWVVTASEDTVVERVIARNNFPEEAIRARINSQLTNAERIKYATLVIENNKLLSDLANAVNEIWKDKIG